ncbi:MAG: alanine dehydrogenase [Candidatus Hydrogenedentes bacterium]|nr:alanine dehydrogenase [Candidatus Hydrogenedentota bacterium]
MLIGVPKEIKADENRVGLVPSGVAAFVQHGHRVLVQAGAGVGSGITDDAYRKAGGEVVAAPLEVWERADLIMKVKEPLGDELIWMREGQIIYTYLHLASDEHLTRRLLERKVAAIGYETIQLDDGMLPLLFPMSEVAGRLSVQKGAQCLEAGSRGRGILLSGVSGVRPANVVILGAGTAGSNACHIAVGMGARVSILDINPARLRYIHDIMGGHVTTVMANTANVSEEVVDADLVICAVLVPGAKAPQLIKESLVKSMQPGAAIVDIAIDQGGCCETSRPTTHHDPIYALHDVIHYCVSNMPGAVPRTSTYALTNVTLSYGLALADKGLEKALHDDKALRRGLNTWQGHVTHQAVAATFGLPFYEV